MVKVFILVKRGKDYFKVDGAVGLYTCTAVPNRAPYQPWAHLLETPSFLLFTVMLASFCIQGALFPYIHHCIPQCLGT